MASAPLLVKINVEFSKSMASNSVTEISSAFAATLPFKFWKSRGLWRALPWQLQLHLHCAHIENFESSLFLRGTLLFTVNSGVILSQISPQMQPHAANANSRVCGRLHFGCLWAFFLHICAFPRSLSIAIRFTFDIPDYPWRFDKLSESTWPDCRPPRWQSN